MHPPKLFMVFDVESIGLHGEGFAVGWVVVDAEGRELESGLAACSSHGATGNPTARKWVHQNVPRLDNMPAPRDARQAFWLAWQLRNKDGAILAAECPWPVEANFLSACVAEDPTAREWEGPYPLIDIASVRFAAGLDPLEKCARLPNELPEHDPLADARQSARLLLEAMRLRPAPSAAEQAAREVLSVALRHPISHLHSLPAEKQNATTPYFQSLPIHPTPAKEAHEPADAEPSEPSSKN